MASLWQQAGCHICWNLYLHFGGNIFWEGAISWCGLYAWVWIRPLVSTAKYSIRTIILLSNNKLLGSIISTDGQQESLNNSTTLASGRYWSNISQLSNGKFRSPLIKPQIYFQDSILVVSYAEQGSLLSFLKSQTITWPELCRMLRDIAHGLSALHSGFEESGSKNRPSICHR